jgi:hypothetical protein
MSKWVSWAVKIQRQELMLVILLVSCYGYFFPRWADWNQNSRFDLVIAIVQDHSLMIDKYMANTGDYAFIDGHYYSDKAPGTALLAAPVYALFRTIFHSPAGGLTDAVASDNPALQATLRPGGSGVQVEKLDYFIPLVIVTFVVVAVPSAILGLLFCRVASHFGLDQRQSMIITLLYGLATSAFPYANNLVGHQLAACLLFTAFAVILGVRLRILGDWWVVCIGFLLGYAVITEYPAAMVAAVLGLYALLALGTPARVVVRLVLGAIPPLILLVVYDYVAFGTPLPIGYLHSTLWTDVHQTGFVSLTYPRLDALWGLTFGVHRGLFFLSPFLLCSALGYWALWQNRKRRAEFWVLVLAPLAFLLFNSSSAMWQGGFAVGPRYLVPSLPFLALAAGVGVAQAWQRPALRPLVAGVGIWSLFAVWAETMGGQSFPDYTQNPLFDLSLPRLAAGDIARNAGMVLGLAGWASLVPLLLVVAVTLGLAGLVRPGRPSPLDEPADSTEGGTRWAW